jgi:hypothetical protein
MTSLRQANSQSGTIELVFSNDPLGYRVCTLSNNTNVSIVSQEIFYNITNGRRPLFSFVFPDSNITPRDLEFVKSRIKFFSGCLELIFTGIKPFPFYSITPESLHLWIIGLFSHVEPMYFPVENKPRVAFTIKGFFPEPPLPKVETRFMIETSDITGLLNSVAHLETRSATIEHEPLYKLPDYFTNKYVLPAIVRHVLVEYNLAPPRRYCEKCIKSGEISFHGGY